ncbi:MAG: pyridoxal phosphate-dependent aminotransferase, partial [Promethearchaeota archaeon]
MNLDKIIINKKEHLKHGSHGGEIYNLNPKLFTNSIFDFSTNINPLVSPDDYYQVYLNSINQIPRYPDSNSTKLKDELVKYFKNEVTRDNLIVGAGSMEIISIFCDMFISPGDEIIINQPTFSEYVWAIQKNKGFIVNVYRKPENNFRIEIDSVLNNITTKTKVIFICNPNNPNGLLDNPEDLKNVIRIASQNDVLVFLDESFIEFTGESNSFVHEIVAFDNLFICRSFSKFFGLTGIRIGFGISTPEIINIVARGQLLWSVNCIAQNLAQEILKSKKLIKDSFKFFSKERQFVINELEKIPGIKIFPSDTNYILINFKNKKFKATQIKKLLIKENILIRDCSNFNGLDDYFIRVCIKTRELNLKLIKALKKISTFK